jgi:prepilin-type N-terminal cleavage/methylation domain-containing protein
MKDKGEEKRRKQEKREESKTMNPPSRIPPPGFARRRALTLIELLIVVVMISITAAISVGAVMYMLGKGKTEHIRQDLLILADALDAYETDHHALPPNVCAPSRGPGFLSANADALFRLTTPVAYAAALPQDPFFESGNGAPAGPCPMGYWRFDPGACRAGKTPRFVLLSNGPNQRLDSEITTATARLVAFDPTNGARSAGDIYITIP